MMVDELDYHWLKELLKELVLCIEKSKWMLCHIMFRACVYDKATKSLRYLPPCQEDCDLYLRKTKSCQELVTQSLDWYRKESPCLSEDLFFVNCSFYPKKLSGICQDAPLSKQLLFVKKIVFGFLFAFKSKVDFLQISLGFVLIYLFFFLKALDNILTK